MRIGMNIDFPLQIHIIELFDNKGPLKAFGVSNNTIVSMALPSFILFAIYLTAFLLSIFLNIKRKYMANTIFLSGMIVLYMIITILGF